MYQTIGWVQLLVVSLSVLVFTGVVGAVVLAIRRAGRRPPHEPSAAGGVSRDGGRSQELQHALGELNRRKDAGKISEAAYEAERARLLQTR